MAAWLISFEVGCLDKEDLRLYLERDLVLDVDPQVGDVFEAIPFDAHPDDWKLEVQMREYSSGRWHIDLENRSLTYAHDVKSLAEAALNCRWTVRCETSEGCKIIDNADQVPE